MRLGFPNVRLALGLLIALGFSGAAVAEDVREQEARAELDRELEAMMKAPPPWVEITFEGIASPSARYELIEGSFELDGTALPFKPQAGQGGRGQVIFSGEIAPGHHVLTTLVAYRELASTFVFSYANLKFKLPGRFSFEAQRGLRLRLPIRVEVDEHADVKKRLQLLAALEAEMVIEVEESAPLPTAAPVRPDAGTVQVASTTGWKPPEGGQDAGPGQATGPGQVRESSQTEVGAQASTKPKRKRIKRHLKNLLQNLAKSSREEAAAAAGKAEVVDEELPAEGSSPAKAAPVLPTSFRATLRGESEPTAPTPSKPSKPAKGSKRSRSKAKSVHEDSPDTSR